MLGVEYWSQDKQWKGGKKYIKEFINKYRRIYASHPEARVILHRERELTKYREKAGVSVEWSVFILPEE